MSDSPFPRSPGASVAFVLTARARDDFLPGGWPASQGFWIDATQGAGAILAQFESVRPRVMVSGWGTPAFDSAWWERPDNPLAYICHLVGSVRQLVPRRFIERGGLVSNWGPAAAVSVAEHALLLALGALRGAALWEAERAPRGASRSLPTRNLTGKRVGLHGFGVIARALVRLLAPFGVTIAAYSAGVPESVFAAEGVAPVKSLSSLFAESDVLFECEALTPATQGIVSAEMLARLPDDAVFVNVGRGRVVDEAALVREARSRRIRVAVDVVAEEPITANSPLAQIPGVLLSPHIGGPAQEDYPRLGEAALANVARYLAGQTPLNLVTADLYDRST